MINFPFYPMLLQKSDTVPIGDRQIHQLKIDGIRCLMHYSPAGIKLASRHLTEMSQQFPEITSFRLNAKDAIIDGEICVLDKESKPSFEQTFARFQVSGQKVNQYLKTLPVTYFAFDIIQLNGESLIHEPLIDRLNILKQVILPSDHLVCLESFEDGQALFQATKNMGLEGIVSKRIDSPYMINKRDDAWKKVKHYMIDIVDVVSIRKGEFGWGLTQGGNYVGITELVPTDARKAFWHVAKQIIENEDKKFYYLKPHFKIKVKSIGRTSKNLLRTPSFVEFVLDKLTG